jgi:hypothetical protein
MTGAILRTGGMTGMMLRTGRESNWLACCMVRAGVCTWLRPCLAIWLELVSAHGCIWLGLVSLHMAAALTPDPGYMVMSLGA